MPEPIQRVLNALLEDIQAGVPIRLDNAERYRVELDGEVRHASQLYQATLEGVVLFAILWWFTSKPRPRLAPSGVFLVGYGTFRILAEFVRLPDAHLGYLAFGWVTMGQVLSLPMIVIGLAMLAWAYRANRRSGNYA